MHNENKKDNDINNIFIAHLTCLFAYKITIKLNKKFNMLYKEINIFVYIVMPFYTVFFNKVRK